MIKEVLAEADKAMLKQLLEHPTAKAVIDEIQGTALTPNYWHRFYYHKGVRELYYNLRRLNYKYAYDYNEPLEWRDLLTYLWESGTPESFEIFLSIVEDKQLVRDIESLEHLEHLTRIRNEGRLEYCYIAGKTWRYITKLETMLRNGGTFDQVTALNASDFGLTDKMAYLSRYCNRDKAMSIAIGLAFDLFSTDADIDFISIADRIGAPMHLAINTLDIRKEFYIAANGETDTE